MSSTTKLYLTIAVGAMVVIYLYNNTDWLTFLAPAPAKKTA